MTLHNPDKNRIDEHLHYLKLLLCNGSFFQPEVRDALEYAIFNLSRTTELASDREVSPEGVAITTKGLPADISICTCGHDWGWHNLQGICKYAEGSELIPYSCECMKFTPSKKGYGKKVYRDQNETNETSENIHYCGKYCPCCEIIDYCDKCNKSTKNEHSPQSEVKPVRQLDGIGNPNVMDGDTIHSQLKDEMQKDYLKGKGSESQ